MSFDLFVLLDNSSIKLQELWVAKMKHLGLDAKFPSGFVIGERDAQEVFFQVRFIPPLVKIATEFESFEINIDFTSITKVSRNDYLDTVESIEMRKKIMSMTNELQLYSQSGRSDRALIFQCYAAACLVDAGNGVLFDPQEFGAVDGAEVYEVAKAHCQPELEQIKYRQPHVSNVSRSPKSRTKYQPLKLFIVIILCALAIDGIWNVFLR